MNNTITKYLLILLISIGCSQSKDMVFEKFKSELERQGLKIKSVDEDGLIHISHNDIDLEVSLDNLRKDFERDRDENRIVEFVATLTGRFIEFPNWNDAKDKIYIGFFPNEIDFSDLVNEKVSDKFIKIYTLHIDNQIRWISKEELIEWNISEKELKEYANKNLSELLDKSTIEIDDLEGHKLGLINCSEITLKSSLVFSENFRNKVEKEFGWPINAVIPVRDFCYIFSKKDFEYFANRIGNVVVKEYTQSSYPITTEILEISDSGVKPVGEYPID